MEGDKEIMLGPNGMESVRNMVKDVMAMKNLNSKPLRPPTAGWRVYLEELTKKYIADNPEHNFEQCVEAIGCSWFGKWECMSPDERAPYLAVAGANRSGTGLMEYKAKVEAYKNKMAEGPAIDQEDDKSKLEVKDAEKDQSGEEKDLDDDE